jgi:choline dehydrogenase-like flavoprotein
VDNLYVVDGSFFVSSGAVNPTLTIIANALRVGDRLLERLGSPQSERLKGRSSLAFNDDFATPSTSIQTEPVLAK